MARGRITPTRGVLAVKCPSCGAPIPWRHVSAAGFFCPACRDGLRISASYFRVLYLLSGAIGALVAYVVGLRDEPLFWVTFLAWWPTYWVVLFITIPLFPPDLETTGDYHGILYDALVEKQESFVAEEPGPPVEEPGAARVESAPQMFSGAGQRRPAGEIVFGTLAVVLLVFAVWMALKPVLYRIAPELGATRVGPSSFPVRLHIGRDALGVSNPSDTQWTCRVELGVWPAYTITAIVASQHSRELPYSSFIRIGTNQGLSPERAARQRIDIECRQPDGIEHLWIAE
jgi:hypothetical protein